MQLHFPWSLFFPFSSSMDSKGYKYVAKMWEAQSKRLIFHSFWLHLLLSPLQVNTVATTQSPLIITLIKEKSNILLHWVKCSSHLPQRPFLLDKARARTDGRGNIKVRTSCSSLILHILLVCHIRL